MKFDINTLKRATCAVIAACVILLGTLAAQAQQRRYRSYGPQVYYGPPVRRDRNLDRRDLRHELQRHQRYERRALRYRLRSERDAYGNNHDWRERRKFERKELKRHQKYEKEQFKQQFKHRRQSY